MRGKGRPLSVTTTATTISLAAGASTTRTSIASKCERTKAASLWPSGTSMGAPRPARFLADGTRAAPFSTAARSGLARRGCRIAAACSRAPAQEVAQLLADRHQRLQTGDVPAREGVLDHRDRRRLARGRIDLLPRLAQRLLDRDDQLSDLGAHLALPLPVRGYAARDFRATSPQTAYRP